MFRLKFLLLSLGLMTLTLTATGCFLTNDAMSVIEYNNEVVRILNNTGAAIEESTDQYDQSIPNIVTESSTIDTTVAETIYKDATTKLSEAQSVLTLISQNEAQQTAVRTEFETYLALGQTYLETYTSMLDYYRAGTYKESLDNVATFDQDLHTEYNDFVKANNNLVDTLSQYVQ